MDLNKKNNFLVFEKQSIKTWSAYPKKRNQQSIRAIIKVF